MSTTTLLRDVTLDDKYTLPSGRIYLSGIQALVRLPLMQRARDAKAGLNTGGFISGYRGSPLGTYDNALWSAKKHLEAENIHFQPGLNEDLAATSVWGSQQVGLFPGANVQGVFGIWYGKGPGVDRSVDALKHANAAGTSRFGGVLALAGDDHGCQSSTLAHQSEQVFQAAMMPILNPSTVQEYLDFGIYGFALSRYSGCWVGFKAISETAESSASIEADPERMQFVEPGEFDMPAGGLHIRWPDPPLEAEARLHGDKMRAVAAFARANPIDRIALDSPAATLGIITTGKAYLDVRQALADLGLSDAACAEIGLRVYKVGLTWPLEVQGARRFAQGLKDVLVVEEKQGFIETQFAHAIFNMDAGSRPSVVGKRNEDGEVLLRSEGELSPTLVARAILSRLERQGLGNSNLTQRIARLESFEQVARTPQIKSQRAPFFCSGCPHNTSTQLPDGSRAMAGIGCHGMVMWMPNRNTETITHMGGEGANWIGQVPFTSEKHVFQNLGDGTYTHSGLLAIRAAAVAKVNITYKILYNDAVAMTGGQSAEGGFTVPQIATQVVAEGAARVVIVSDEPDKYTDKRIFPPGISFHGRDELDSVQRQLRDINGLTVLIYDQTCAAEKRRRRKRGLYPDPPKRAFINDLVCEGCGDCSVKSNCVSVKPLETELGRKRVIDQSSCNKDFSCTDGFCPSFVTVHGGGLRKPVKAAGDAAGDRFAALPMPVIKPLLAPYDILMTGIGGTGVVTIGALLGMAAHIEGKGCSVLDFTGLAQKNGGVMSHVRLAPKPEDIAAVRIAAGAADLLLGCDMVVAASPVALSRMEHGVTRAVVNTTLTPTAAFVTDGNIDFEANLIHRVLRKAVGDDGIDFIDASRIATALMGDSIATNLFLLGYVFQKGLLPIGFEALDRAIVLNGGGVQNNQRTFAWGRLAAHDPASVDAFATPASAPVVKPLTLPERIESNAKFLAAYQDQAYAQRYRNIVSNISLAERRAVPGSEAMTGAVAGSLFKLMAYKDEYEVARLYTEGSFRAKLERQFEGDYKLQIHLAPPLLSRRDPVTGHLKKRAFGGWVLTAFSVLARLKGLRGTSLDIFGYTAERRMERQLIDRYIADVGQLSGDLDSGNLAIAVELASLPEMVKGYGHVKDLNIAAMDERRRQIMMQVENCNRSAPSSESLKAVAIR
ncbi:indolepyruvate ferredoxin oxidoreductase family protein [Tardiphaga sp. vice154]|uniref:indolepyruvate ferredoxin oxidoreductase family protein n=1 Tax=Tardiphaga sp. vice154 TaxID=2592814 RepID=UPI00116454FD|nr:indolepyruvate ferredoxin oxidoreductase family protein [Tardiphaga sp. vice154]QDM22699.1 indolepyruvate ferredoxin oxidoreductase family protein [Tardiphaga sp. vice154]